MDIVVKIENVTKVYGNQTVLNNVSLICEKGNIYGLVGRNGSGKTVLNVYAVLFTQPAVLFMCGESKLGKMWILRKTQVL